MASLRVTKVRDEEYLQVVEYYTEDNKHKLRVLKSFGKNILANRLKALQFESSYNLLKAFKDQVAPQNADDLTTIFNTALAIFGTILGAAIIADLLGKGRK